MTMWLTQWITFKIMETERKLNIFWWMESSHQSFLDVWISVDFVISSDKGLYSTLRLARFWALKVLLIFLIFIWSKLPDIHRLYWNSAGKVPVVMRISPCVRNVFTAHSMAGQNLPFWSHKKVTTCTAVSPISITPAALGLVCRVQPSLAVRTISSFKKRTSATTSIFGCYSAAECTWPKNSAF